MNMRTTELINLKQLNHGDFLQFNVNILAIAVQHPILEAVSAQFKDDVTLLESAYLKESLTLETKKIVALDEERDEMYTHFKLRVEAEAFNRKSLENRQAAERIKSIIKQHGGATVTRYDYNKATATFASFVDAVNTQQAVALQQLGLADELHAIEEANKAFSAFYSLRNQRTAELNTVPAFYKLRPMVRESYKKMIKAVESLPLFDASHAAEVEQVIQRINIEIAKFRLLLPTPKNKEAG